MNPEDEIKNSLSEMEKLLSSIADVKGGIEKWEDGDTKTFNYTVDYGPESRIEELEAQLKKERAKVRKLRKELKAEKLNTVTVKAAEEKAQAKALPGNRLEAVE
jgi:hypothetical protein